MKRLTTKIVIIAIAALVVVGIAAYFIWNKIKADTTNYSQVVTGEDIQTTKAVESPEPDTRSEVAVPILMYHHIRNYNDPNDKIGTNLSVPPENFKAQIDYLKSAGFSTITFSDFIAYPAKKLPEKPVILSFDDGYQDAFDYAYKPLLANGQVGVFFVIINFLDRPDHMTKIEAAEMADSGMEIGSHTLDHPDLTKLTSEKLTSELSESKSILENLTGKKVISFCYPTGQHNDFVDAAARDTGYLVATTTQMAISSTSENKFTLSRLRINPNDSLTYFADKIVNYKP